MIGPRVTFVDHAGARWRALHFDSQREVVTCERDRRFRRGRLRLVSLAYLDRLMSVSDVCLVVA